MKFLRGLFTPASPSPVSSPVHEWGPWEITGDGLPERECETCGEIEWETPMSLCEARAKRQQWVARYGDVPYSPKHSHPKPWPSGDCQVDHTTESQSGELEAQQAYSDWMNG